MGDNYCTSHGVVLIAGIVTSFPVESALVDHGNIPVIKHLERSACAGYILCAAGNREN